MATQLTQKPSRHRVTLLAMFAITVLPFGLAALYYEHITGDESIPTSNNGKFLKPPAQLSELRLQSIAGGELTPRKWRLLLYRPGQCGGVCATAERNLRALPLLVGRDAARVQIALVATDATTNATTNATTDAATQFPGAAITVLRAAGHVQGIDEGLLLADPLGNVVLWYSYAQVGKPLLEDLRHLLKVSEFG